MNILLVLPAVEPFRVRADGRRVPRRAMLRFSVLPLTMIAAATPRRHQVVICDENVQPLDLDADVDVVGIGFMTALAPRAFEIARRFRQRGVITVAGGYHPTLCPDQTAEHFDAVVLSEGEDTWPRVLRDIEAGTPQRIYRPDCAVNLAALPTPRRDLTRAVSRHYVTTSAVQTGRGCPHHCAYCSITAFHGGTYRARPVGQVVDELRTLPRRLMFVDDNIIADPAHARALFEAMVPLRKRWVSQCSVRIADDPELLALAHRAGCRGLFIGIESISAESLKSVDKSFNDPQSYARRLAAIRRQGIGVQASIMVGFDHDGTDVFRRTLRVLQRARVDALQLNIVTPLPGTPLFDHMDRLNRVIDRDLSRYDFIHTVFRPAKMSPAQLQAGAEWLYRQFYRPDRVAWRCMRAVWRLGPLAALLILRLSLTYRADFRRRGFRGLDPAAARRRPAWWQTWRDVIFLRPDRAAS